jgi:hypothetical protein
MARRKRRPWAGLPHDVGEYVADQLARDWDTLAKPCREVCKDCPADRDGEESPCLSCPFSGLSTLAATITITSKMIRLKENNK